MYGHNAFASLAAAVAAAWLQVESRHFAAEIIIHQVIAKCEKLMRISEDLSEKLLDENYFKVSTSHSYSQTCEYRARNARRSARRSGWFRERLKLSIC